MSSLAYAPLQGSDSSSSCEEELEREQLLPRQANRERYMQRSIVQCTPQTAFGAPMADYVAAQTRSVKKQWIYEIIGGTREAADKILENEHFILTPDIEANTANTANWLAVFKDTSLHSIRSLEGRHVEMLEEARDLCVAAMAARTGFRPHEIMCYFHYLPSVFQLHLHVCAPYGLYTTPDVYKVHPIDNVISNLRIDPLYYQRATITTVVVGKGELSGVYPRQRVRSRAATGLPS
jgi:m7GpppX diphosphatase